MVSKHRIKFLPTGLPLWFPAIRTVQLFFALIIIGLTGYSLSIHSGSQIRPALILTIITAIFALLSKLLLVVPVPKSVHHLVVLVSDFLLTLLWLASLVALASYLRIFNYYRKVESIPFAPGAQKISRAWRCSVTAAVFTAFELLFYLLTVTLFALLSQHHHAGTQPHPALLRPSRRRGATSPDADAFALENSTSSAAPLPSGAPAVPAPAPAPRPHPAPHRTGVPNITTTAATPTTTAAQRPGGVLPSESGQGAGGYASPVIPDPEVGVGARVAEKARPPYPMDEDEERGAIGKAGGRGANGGAMPAPLFSERGDGGVSAR